MSSSDRILATALLRFSELTMRRQFVPLSKWTYASVAKRLDSNSTAKPNRDKANMEAT